MSQKNIIYDIPSLEEIDKELDRRYCAMSFAEFVKRGWHVLEPSTPLKWGWVMQAICDHLQAVAEGKITRLLINVPPGFSKSLLTSVFYPAWLWGPAKQPDKRIVGTSHSKDLAIRDSMKNRTLVESEWYQERWGVQLKGDQNAKSNFGNVNQGTREAAAFTKMTGKRGDVVILDDPISAFDANSEAELYNAEIAFLETLPSRVNSEDSAIIVIMQRLSERDTSGLILERPELGYEALILPMRFEPSRRCTTSIGFTDPRTKDGELLFPEFFNEERVKKLESSLGSFGTSGQLQQSPVPRSGGLFQREWLKPLMAEPHDLVSVVRGYDIAATASARADYTVGAKVGKTRDGKIVICDIWRGQYTAQAVRSRIVQTAADDGVKTRISIPQDPGAAGKGMVEQYRQDLIGYDVRFSPETGDKTTRALPLAAQAEAGAVYYVVGDWNKDFLDEVSVFPNAKHDDQVDACSRAFNELLKLSKTTGGGVSVSGPMILN
jgi:predicted phage terminase large subunit-like protein